MTYANEKCLHSVLIRKKHEHIALGNVRLYPRAAGNFFYCLVDIFPRFKIWFHFWICLCCFKLFCVFPFCLSFILCAFAVSLWCFRSSVFCVDCANSALRGPPTGTRLTVYRQFDILHEFRKISEIGRGTLLALQSWNMRHIAEPSYERFYLSTRVSTYLLGMQLSY